MNKRTLVLILSGLFLLNNFPAYSKTSERLTQKSTVGSAHFDLEEAVIGLDPEWNVKPSTLFLNVENGYDFILPGKKAAHIHFPRILNSNTPITIKTKSGNILQYLVSRNSYRAQVMGKYLVYQGNHNAILYRYDVDKRQLREFVYLKEASALPENGEVIEWRFEGVDLKPRSDGSVLLSKTVNLKKEIRQVSDNNMADRIGRFMEKKYGKKSSKQRNKQPLFVIPSPEYVSRSGEVRKQGISYRVNKSSLTLVMESRAPLVYPLWIDPSLSAETDSDVTLNGQDSSDRFGTSLSSAGDFNGDGLEDVIVGAPSDVINGPGSAFIFFGGKTGTINDPDTNADVILNGEGIGDAFGSSVASAGDFNGDGLDDVIVSAPLNEQQGFDNNSGSAFIFFGGRTGTINDPDTNADVVLNSGETMVQFGTSVASAGDFNGDDLGDVIVGAPNKDQGFLSNTGGAYIFFGGQTGTINDAVTNADVIINGPGIDYLLGKSVAPAGDFNGDGLSDVIVGAPGKGMAQGDPGGAYIIFGGQSGTIDDLDTNADVILNGTGFRSDFGESVASAGDFNGDGLDDVIVGANFLDNNGLMDSGSAYIYFGGQSGTIDDPDTNADVVLNGRAEFDHFGISVAPLGDLNKDGLDDIIVGATITFDENGSSITGRAYIFFGGHSGTINNPDTNADGIINDTDTGLSGPVASANDFNGDGQRDVIVQANNKVVIFFSPFVEPAVHNDFNGDGTSDLLIHNTALGHIGVGLIQAGVVQSGGLVLTADPAAGWTLNSTGDFNGDRKADLLLFNTTTGEIRTVLLDGSTILSDVTVMTLDPAFGLEPQGTADTDGDGKSEILLFNLTTGLVVGLVVDGAIISAAGAITTLDVGNFFTLSDTGDFDGDGKDDLYVTSANNALAYVPLDGLNPPGAQVLLFTFGPLASQRPVGVGDFNEDGLVDVLISDIPNPDPAGTLSVSLQDGVTIVSTHNLSDNFSRDLRVLNASDYDGDGKSDVLLFNTVTGQAAILLMDGTTPLSIQAVAQADIANDWTIHSGKP